MSAHVVRLILLGGAIRSGRWWLDPDDMLAQDPAIGDLGAATTGAAPNVHVEANDGAELHPTLPDLAGNEGFTTGEFNLLVHAAALAPSGGNAQPWRFMHHQGRLLVFLDQDRARSALDPGSRYAELAMGACVENIALEASRNGLDIELNYRPLGGNEDLVATIELKTRGSNGLLSDALQRLAHQIEARCTNRKASEVLQLADEEAHELLQGLEPDASTSIQLVRDRGIIDRLSGLTGRAERIRFLNTDCHHDMFVKEMRWDRRQVEETRDGIDLDTLELPLADRVGLRVAADVRAMGLLRGWGGGMAIERITARSVKASGALALVSVKDLDLASTFQAGRTMQRFWLKCSLLGILAHPVGAAIFMGLHGRFDRSGMLSEREHREAGQVLEELKQLVDTHGHEPFFLLRLGRASGPEVRSLRRPIHELILTAPSTQRP